MGKELPWAKWLTEERGSDSLGRMMRDQLSRVEFEVCEKCMRGLQESERECRAGFWVALQHAYGRDRGE